MGSLVPLEGGSPGPLEGDSLPVDIQDRLLLGMVVERACHEEPWDRGAESWWFPLISYQETPQTVVMT